MKRCLYSFGLFVLLALALAGCGSQSTSSSNSGPVTLNLAYFPNVTHAVALVGSEDVQIATCWRQRRLMD